jgi:hypothetical protein
MKKSNVISSIRSELIFNQKIFKSLLMIGISVFLNLSVFSQEYNGIGVSNPKIFDNRSLMIMLEELNRTLENVKVIDQASLNTNLGLSQGFQSQSVERSFEVGSSPLPGIVTTRTPDPSGNLGISEQVTTQAGLSPTKPALPDLQTSPQYQPTFGIGSEDLLTKQIDLSYKIFNLRMLLERSISDRLTSTEDGSRLQTVLGFNISLDPPKEKRDMAAFVELTIETGDKPVSLVALMPQEKTYNASALSTKSNAFGGSAVFKVFTVGYSERRQGQNLYLYQAADTITYQRMPDTTGDFPDISNEAPTFGWEFRPVLGQRSVSPGMKQVFAVLSIDKRDLDKVSTSLKVKVRTFWRKFSHKTSTVHDDETDVRTFSYGNTKVFTTAKYQEGLSPVVNNVKWNQLDNNNGVLTIEGENFFTGTSVLVGNNVLNNPANGLTIKSEQSLQVRTNLDNIAGGDVVINGRYGNSEPVRIVNSQTEIKGLVMSNLSTESLSDKTTRVSFFLHNKSHDNLPNNTQAESNKSMVIINDQSKGGINVENITKYSVPPVVLINNNSFIVKNSLQNRMCNFYFYEWFNPNEIPNVIEDDSTPLTKSDGSLILDKNGNQITDKKLKYEKQDEIRNEVFKAHEKNYQKPCVFATFDVPSAILKEDVSVSFKMPLLSSDWSATSFYSPKTALKLTKVAADKGKSYYTIRGRNLKNLKALSPTNFINFSNISDNQLMFELTDAQIAATKNIFLKYPNNDEIFILELPDLPKPPSPKITDTNPVQVLVGSSKTVTFKGENLTAIQKAFFEDTEIKIIKKKADEITVYLSRAVTKKTGDIEIILKSDGDFVIGKVTVVSQIK